MLFIINGAGLIFPLEESNFFADQKNSQRFALWGAANIFLVLKKGKTFS
jgi:hypothetical protein